MQTYAAGFARCSIDRIKWSILVAGGLNLSLLAMSAGAQINRSRPPDPPPDRGGSSGSRSQPSSTPPPRSTSASSGSDSGSYTSSDRGRTSSRSGRDSGGSTAADKLNGTDRGSSSSLDRFHRSREGTDSKTPNGRIYRIHVPYDPYGRENDPYDHYSSPYALPDRRPPAGASYDSPYLYSEDFSAGLYVSSLAVVVASPKKLFVPIPIYHIQQISGWRDLGANDYMQDRNADAGSYRKEQQSALPDPALEEAIQDIVLSWELREIEPLARHLRRDQRVAVILRDKYRYSLEGGDFLKMTHDALSSVTTARFVLDHVHRKADGIYTLTGRHLYTDQDKNERAAYMSYVLIKIEAAYIITQIGAAPDRE